MSSLAALRVAKGSYKLGKRDAQLLPRSQINR
jgi:hypothetical protein